MLVARGVLSPLNALIAGLCLWATSCAAVTEVVQSPARSAARIAYDIPSQALETALGTYAAVSGVQVLYETALTADRYSTAVKGRLTPETALRTLLAGTGLVGRRTDVDAFTIVPARRKQTGSVPSPGIPDSHFLGALQAGILEVLCRYPETQPGDYRVALQLWIAPGGGIQRVALIGSTGDEDRDATLVAALRDLVVDTVPPVGVPQPITMAIVPRLPHETGDCAD